MNNNSNHLDYFINKYPDQYKKLILKDLIRERNYLLKMQAQKTQAHKTQSEKTQAQKTQSEKTQAQKTQSEKTQSEKTQSQKTQAQKTQSEKTQSEKTQSEKTQSEKTQVEKSYKLELDLEKKEIDPELESIRQKRLLIQKQTKILNDSYIKLSKELKELKKMNKSKTLLPGLMIKKELLQVTNLIEIRKKAEKRTAYQLERQRDLTIKLEKAKSELFNANFKREFPDWNIL